LEALESRLPLHGNVQVEFISGVLKITGDPIDNQINIRQITTSGVTRLSVTGQAQSGTTVNHGRGFLQVVPKGNVEVYMGAGNDAVSVQDVHLTRLVVHAGASADDVSILRTTIDGPCAINLDLGGDTLSANALLVGGKLSISAGRDTASNQMFLTDVVAANADVLLGVGGDAFRMAGGRIGVAKDGHTVIGELNFNGQSTDAGSDSITLTRGAQVGNLEALQLGNGANTLNFGVQVGVDDRVNAQTVLIHGNLSAASGSQSYQVRVGNAEFDGLTILNGSGHAELVHVQGFPQPVFKKLVPNGFDFKSQEPDNRISVGALTVNLLDDHDQTISDVKADSLTVIGSDADDTLILSNVHILQGTSIDLGNGNNRLEIGQNCIFGDSKAFPTFIATRSGNDSLVVSDTTFNGDVILSSGDGSDVWQLTDVGCKAEATFDFGAGDDSATVFNLGVVDRCFFALGEGNNSLSVRRDQVDKSVGLRASELSITGGSGQDRVTLAGTAAPTVSMDLGDGRNNLLIAATQDDNSGIIADNFDVLLGSGDDQVSLDDVEITQRATISLGDGNNTFRTETGHDFIRPTDGVKVSRIGFRAQELNVNSGSGDDVLLIKEFGTRGDKAGVDTEPHQSAAALNVDTGGGADSLMIYDAAVRHTSLKMGAGDDVVDIQRLSGQDQIQGTTFLLDAGDGDDFVSFGKHHVDLGRKLPDYTLAANIRVLLGAGDDLLLGKGLSASGGTLTITGSSGDDEVRLGVVLASILDIRLGDGDDLLVLGQQVYATAAQFSLVDGGAGHDRLQYDALVAIPLPQGFEG
jgi:hypothetical protein